MSEIILFLLTFLLIFLLYQLFIVKKAKRKKNRKEPLEITYLAKKYHLDLEKVSYNQLLQLIAITSSFDISVIVTLILPGFFYPFIIYIGYYPYVFVFCSVFNNDSVIFRCILYLYRNYFIHLDIK